MGYRGYKVVAVTPAGRRRYMEILLPLVLSLCEVVDEYQLWVNTTDGEDVAWIEAAAAKHPRVACKYLPPGAQVNGYLSIHHFFARTTEPRTLYVRFDDDVVGMDDAAAFKAFLDYRIDNPKPLLVFANTLNNAVCSYVHQHFGGLAANTAAGKLAGYACMCPVGWKDPEFARSLHEEVLEEAEAKRSLAAFRWPRNWVMHEYDRVSINCISWLGDDFALFGGRVGSEEEQWLSSDKPRELARPCVIFGGFVVAHYAFVTQREVLDELPLLTRYAALAEERCRGQAIVPRSPLVKSGLDRIDRFVLFPGRAAPPGVPAQSVRQASVKPCADPSIAVSRAVVASLLQALDDGVQNAAFVVDGQHGLDAAELPSRLDALFEAVGASWDVLVWAQGQRASEALAGGVARLSYPVAAPAWYVVNRVFMPRLLEGLTPATYGAVGLPAAWSNTVEGVRVFALSGDNQVMEVAAAPAPLAKAAIKATRAGRRR